MQECGLCYDFHHLYKFVSLTFSFFFSFKEKTAINYYLKYHKIEKPLEFGD